MFSSSLKQSESKDVGDKLTTTSSGGGGGTAGSGGDPAGGGAAGALDAKLADRLASAKAEYETYAAKQSDFKFPDVKISFEEDDNDGPTRVFMDVQYSDTNFHFRSIEAKDADPIQLYLNSQVVVREKYANGKVVPAEATQDRVGVFCQRFDRKDPLYLYSGFMVLDAETEQFLGICNLGGGMTEGASEMAFLNRADAWSLPPIDVVEKYAVPSPLKKQYKGVATAEVCTLLQFAHELKTRDCLVRGKELVKVDATARPDNPGSWKACAKAGMELERIDVREAYGEERRLQLTKRM